MVTHPGSLRIEQALTFGLVFALFFFSLFLLFFFCWFGEMAAAVACPNSLVAFFPANIYRTAGSSAVLPELLRSVDREKVSTVQFLRNGAVRLTYKAAADCDAAVSNGITYGDVALRVVGVEARARLVYLRDCPTEVPDSTVRGFFAAYGEVHSISRSCHDAFPGLFEGNRVVKMTLTKDIASSVRVAGYDCRVWYKRQPASCSICKKLGHRGRSCPLDGLCRRCRQPGHVARECRNAWGASGGSAAASSSSVPTASAATASSAGGSSSGVPPASAAAPADVSPSVDVPASPSSVLLPSAALAPEEEESDMEFVPAPISDDPESVADEEMCSGDKEVLREAAAAAADDAPSSPRPRRSRRRKKKKPQVTLADLSPVAMDLSSEDDPDSTKLLRSFDEVWHDRLTWEELRSARHGYVLKKVGDRILAVAGPPVLQFGDASDVVSCPVKHRLPSVVPPCAFDSVWAHSPHRVRLPDSEDGICESHIDFGVHTANILRDEIHVDTLRIDWYNRNHEARPCRWRPLASARLPPLPSDLPPSLFSVYVPYVE